MILTTPTIPVDTDLEAHAVQIALYRQMTPEKKLKLLFTMCHQSRELVKAGIRMRHPDYSESQVRDALFRMLLGDDLFREAYPDRALLPP